MVKDVYAIWVLDDETNRKLDEIKKALETFNIEYKSIYGHITFASFIDIEVEEIVKYTKRFSEKIESFDINCSALGFLSSNCIACIPSTTGKLQEYYNEYHREFDSYCNVWTSMADGLWLPHISLYFSDTKDLGAIIGEMLKKFTQFKGKVIRLELSEWDGEKFDTIYSKDLE